MDHIPRRFLVEFYIVNILFFSQFFFPFSQDPRKLLFTTGKLFFIALSEDSGKSLRISIIELHSNSMYVKYNVENLQSEQLLPNLSCNENRGARQIVGFE